MADIIPRTTSGYYKFTKQVIDYSQSKADVWRHIPTEVISELSDSFNEFTIEYERTNGDSPASQIKRRNLRQKESEKLLRHFIKFYLRNPIVSDDDLLAMNIKPIDKTRTQHTTVHETVEFNIRIKGTNNIIIDFRPEGAKNRAKPNGYDGAVVIWTLAENEPLTLEEYGHHVLASRTPYIIEFRNTHDSGKKCWIRVAWQNARGIVGRWSEAKCSIVP